VLGDEERDDGAESQRDEDDDDEGEKERDDVDALRDSQRVRFVIRAREELVDGAGLGLSCCVA
jgi:hypothetical protein